MQYEDLFCVDFGGKYGKLYGKYGKLINVSIIAESSYLLVGKSMIKFAYIFIKIQVHLNKFELNWIELVGFC